jgi:hypothetical protein
MRVLGAIALVALLSAGGAVRADDDDGCCDWDRDRGRRSEGKEKVREGPCLVEREWKADGSFKEQRECKGRARGWDGGDFEEKLEDGPCKIEREGKSDGTYKEKIECKGRG